MAEFEIKAIFTAPYSIHPLSVDLQTKNPSLMVLFSHLKMKLLPTKNRKEAI